MTIGDWLILGGYAISLFSGIIIAVQRLNTSTINAKLARETTSNLLEHVNTVNVKAVENSVELTHLKATVEKHDARLTRLENHFFNL